MVAEGLSKAGEDSPSAALTARASTRWIEEIKNDLWKNIRRPTYLQVTSYGVFVPGQSRYSMPADFSSDLTLTLLDGDVSGIAQNGGAGSVTLALGTNFSEAELLGRGILITSGTGKGAYGQITAYDPVTRIALVTPNFGSSPALNSGYMIVSRECDIDQKHVGQYANYKRLPVGEPRVYFPVGDEDFGEFITDAPPDKLYGARLRYYANIMKIDNVSTLMSTLYMQWRNFWIKGIEWKYLEENDHQRADKAEGQYRQQVAEIRLTQEYGKDLSGLMMHVPDYY